MRVVLQVIVSMTTNTCLRGNFSFLNFVVLPLNICSLKNSSYHSSRKIQKVLSEARYDEN